LAWIWFSISLNSTVSDLAFNSTSRNLSFTVQGLDNTTGYADVYVSKTLIDDITKVETYMDGNPIDHTTTSSIDSWLLHFTYLHSTHMVVLSMGQLKSETSAELPLGIIAIGGIIIVAFAISSIIVLRRRTNHKNKSEKAFKPKQSIFCILEI
jgi:hypothetical protein